MPDFGAEPNTHQLTFMVQVNECFSNSDLPNRGEILFQTLSGSFHFRAAVMPRANSSTIHVEQSRQVLCMNGQSCVGPSKRRALQKFSEAKEKPWPMRGVGNSFQPAIDALRCYLTSCVIAPSAKMFSYDLNSAI
eukprot:Gb_08860 [translate_table: standard]